MDFKAVYSAVIVLLIAEVASGMFIPPSVITFITHKFRAEHWK